jgi:hypothetical protein
MTIFKDVESRGRFLIKEKNGGDKSIQNIIYIYMEMS